jgi:hypothetical protein
MVRRITVDHRLSEDAGGGAVGKRDTQPYAL